MDYIDVKISDNHSTGRVRGIRIRHLLLALIVLGLLLPTRGLAASWETVKNFAPLVPTQPNPPSWPEDVQLGGIGGMAINMTGAGGVAPGTVYTVGSSVSNPWHIARYSPEGTFELAWRKFERCGPAATPPTTCPSFPSGASGGVDIAVDQTTGNVYVFNINETPKAVREYKADGAGPIAEFGEFEASGTAASSPEKLHGSTLNENIAVDAAGNVYVFDEDTSTDFFHRLMVFRPQTPGDYEHYVYAGKSSDIGAGLLTATRPPARPAVDNAGNVYVSGETYIEKYSPAQPSTPICTFSLPTGGISSIAVNPVTGAVFYYAYKPERLVHQLNPCSSGTFVENKAENPPFKVVPERGNLEGMAVNPSAEFPPVGRSPGILYAGAGEPCPIIGACPKEAQGQSALGYIFAPQVRLEPVVESESVTKVGETSATLNAQVNPKGSQTTYVFEYISDAAYQQNDPANRFAGANEAPVGGAELGSGQQALLAAVTIGGLSPATTYHYRVTATNSDGSAVGEDETFQTFPSEVAGLPDGRAYELVSPSQKAGGEVLPAAPNVASCGNECKPGLAASRFPVQVAPSGDAIAYQGQPFSLNEGSPEYDEYVATRSPSGWQNVSQSPPLMGDASGVLFEAFGLDTNLSRDVVYATNGALAPEAPSGYRNLFGQIVGNRFGIDPLLRQTPPNRPNTGPGVFQLKFAGASADLSRIFFEANDALTEATQNAPAAVAGTANQFNLYEWHAGQLSLVNVKPGNGETQPGAAFGAGTALANPSAIVSDFSYAISPDGLRVFWSSASGQVYVRENGEVTREIPDHAGKFLSASADGSKVLLSDGTIYDLETEASTDLTEGSGGFQGIVGQSEDLSSVYFVATSVLTGAPNAEGDTAEPGKNNLYAWQNGAVSFVADLLSSDNSTSLGLWRASPVQRAAEASPNGRWLAFNSKAVLTDPNTTGACSFNPNLQKYVGSVPCEEVYLFDSQSESLTCVSCNPTGAHPLGGSFLRIMRNAQGYLSQPRYLTNDGRLYFDSRDALSSLDTNNQVEDVYQYEPAGVGSCAKAGGCVGLITSGHGSYDANFLAADSSGNNVFFTTRQQLVPRDQDALIDLYDARVGGGIAADSALPPAPCLGEGCQPPTPPLQSEPSAGSNGFEGPGNLKPKKAKKHHKKKHHKQQKKKNQKGKKHKGKAGRGQGGSK
jgi:hypothetical protein